MMRAVMLAGLLVVGCGGPGAGGDGEVLSGGQCVDAGRFQGLQRASVCVTAIGPTFTTICAAYRNTTSETLHVRVQFAAGQARADADGGRAYVDTEALDLDLSPGESNHVCHTGSGAEINSRVTAYVDTGACWQIADEVSEPNSC